jgi:AraC-like DNA-binding protein
MSDKCHSILRDRRGRLTAQIASVSAELPSGRIIPVHFHPEDQLIFASRGVMTVSTVQGIWVVPPMRAVWIPANTPHSVRMCGPVSMRTLYFLPGLVRAFPARCLVLNVSPLLKELILHACAFARLNRKVAPHRRVIAVLVDQLKAAGSVPLQLPYPTDLRGMRVARALETHPAEHASLDRLSRNSGASKRTIERIFLMETKMSFRQWRQQSRLLHAMQLLAAGEKVTGAALDAGYSSPSAFISMFKKQLGATPARYFRS